MLCTVVVPCKHVAVRVPTCSVGQGIVCTPVVSSGASRVAGQPVLFTAVTLLHMHFPLVPQSGSLSLLLFAKIARVDVS